MPAETEQKIRETPIYVLPVGGAALPCSFLGASRVHAQEQCAAHTIAHDDTLRKIARRINVRAGLQIVINANTDDRDSPNRVEVGRVLPNSCADGSQPTSTRPQRLLRTLQPLHSQGARYAEA